VPRQLKNLRLRTFSELPVMRTTFVKSGRSTVDANINYPSRQRVKQNFPFEEIKTRKSEKKIVVLSLFVETKKFSTCFVAHCAHSRYISLPRTLARRTNQKLLWNLLCKPYEISFSVDSWRSFENDASCNARREALQIELVNINVVQFFSINKFLRRIAKGERQTTERNSINIKHARRATTTKWDCNVHSRQMWEL
jgi:hypothetical protein